MTDERVIDALERLKTDAPETLLGRVMVATGLKDGYTPIETAAGPMFVAFNDDGVAACRFGSDESEFEAWFESTFHRQAIRVDGLPARLAAKLERAIASGKVGTLPLDLGGLSDFAQRVLLKTAQIPPGEVRSYGWVAREIDRPGATRAVGSALNRNPIPVLIPCHRVVPSTGRLGNYAFGPEVKRTLLEAEGLDVDELEDAAERGIRFTGSDTTRIYCNPTCHAAQRTTTKHQVEFRSVDAARSAGYRPCKLCRPQAA